MTETWPHKFPAMCGLNRTIVSQLYAPEGSCLGASAMQPGDKRTSSSETVEMEDERRRSPEHEKARQAVDSAPL